MNELLVKEGATVRKIIVVLGMHRSGTSAVTRGLEALGVSLGDNFVPDNWDNELGFWEDADMVAFNEDLQSKLGYKWYGNIVIDRIDWGDNEIITAKEKAKELLEAKFSQCDIYGFKDPRTAVLIEFWLEVFRDLGLSSSYLIVMRNPLDVAESLLKRNELEREKSLLLWAASIIQSITFTKNETRLVVGYDEMLRGPVEQLSRIASVFELPPVISESEAVVRYCNEFLTKEMRHSNLPDSELYTEAVVPPVVSDLYFLLKKVAIDEISINDVDFYKIWDLLYKRYKDVVPILKYHNHIENTKDISERNCHEKILVLEGELETCSVGLKNTLDEIDKLQATLSWRVTKPLRLLKMYLKEIGR